MSTIFIAWWLCLSTTLRLLNADVHQLDEENFEEMTKDGLWYLEFYAPWCGHCKKFAPVYEEASNDPELQNIKFGAIDATSQKEIAKKFEVSRFPTLKFFENDNEYKYTGARTAESLKKTALKMLEPAIKPLSVDTFSAHFNRFTVSFVYIANDINTQINHQSNDDAFAGLAMKFRPEIPFFSVRSSDLTANYNSEFLTQLQLNNAFTSDTNSVLLAVSPSIGSVQYDALSWTVSELQEFVEMNRFAPLIELRIGNYRELVDHCDYFTIVFVDGSQQSTSSQHANKLMDAAEQLIVAHPEWNQRSMVKHRAWKTEQLANDVDMAEIVRHDRVPMYNILMSWCNATKYVEWAEHTFGISADALPLLLVYTPKEDGYWIYDASQHGELGRFVDDVFSDQLEITYTRNWIARQAIKLERWLNSLNGWQIAAVFIGVFIFLCGIMVLLDYCCSPTQSESLKND